MLKVYKSSLHSAESSIAACSHCNAAHHFYQCNDFKTATIISGSTVIYKVQYD